MAYDLDFIYTAESGEQVANFDMTNVFAKGYDQYFITTLFENSSANGGYFTLKFFDSSGAIIDSGNEYAYSGSNIKSYGGFDNTWYSASANLIAPFATGTNDDYRGGGAEFCVYNPDDAASYTFVTGISTSYMDSGLDGAKFGGVHKSEEVITGIRILSYGKTTSMKASVYGVK
jgi:hypothetical protein